MSVKFNDNSAKVKSAMDDAILSYLHEAGAELEAQTKSNSRPISYGNHDVKNSWEFKVDESKKETTIGSPLEAAYWEELGTGEYALNKDGRKGWWVYVPGNSSSSHNQKQYTKEEAIQIMAMLRSDGIDAHITQGVHANRPLFKSFTTSKSALIKRARQVLKARFKE